MVSVQQANLSECEGQKLPYRRHFLLKSTSLIWDSTVMLNFPMVAQSPYYMLYIRTTVDPLHLTSVSVFTSVLHASINMMRQVVHINWLWTSLLYSINLTYCYMGLFTCSLIISSQKAPICALGLLHCQHRNKQCPMHGFLLDYHQLTHVFTSSE